MKGTKPRRFTMLRELVLADLVTLANAACGTASIFLCLDHLAESRPGLLWAAFALFPLALACDVLDGKIARWRRKHSALGADLDSLADVVSFGVAPAVVGFTVGMRTPLDAVVLIYFVVCGISRLARFNVTAETLADESGKVRYYEGTPIPTSLAVVMVLAIGFAMGRTGDALWLGVLRLGPVELHPLVMLYALSGSLMISATVKIPKP